MNINTDDKDNVKSHSKGNVNSDIRSVDSNDASNQKILVLVL
jgi:hypothetical protein